MNKKSENAYAIVKRVNSIFEWENNMKTKLLVAGICLLAVIAVVLCYYLFFANEPEIVEGVLI